MINNNEELEEQLVSKHYGLVISQALYFCKHKRSILDDYIQVGCIGLLKAIRNYSPEKSKFSTFATTCIRNELLRYNTKESRFRYLPLNDYKGKQSVLVWEYLPDTITKKELQIIKLKTKNYSIREICDELFCTRKEFRRMYKDIIKKLRKSNE